MNRDGQGRKRGKGSGIEVLPVSFFGICKRRREIFSLKNRHSSLPTPLCLCTNETNLFSALSHFCFVTEELGGCDSKEMEAS